MIRILNKLTNSRLYIHREHKELFYLLDRDDNSYGLCTSKSRKELNEKIKDMILLVSIDKKRMSMKEFDDINNSKMLNGA